MPAHRTTRHTPHNDAQVDLHTLASVPEDQMEQVITAIGMKHGHAMKFKRRQKELMGY